jgi:uncharacterized phiE125 gp8 family phage protein
MYPTWTNLTYRGFDYGGYCAWRDRLPRLPHVVSICSTPPTEEVFTLDEAKLRAGFTWPSPDERDALINQFIRTARAKVEFDTGLALLDQTREVYFDVLTSNVINLPEHSIPLTAVAAVDITGSDGTITTLDPSTYWVDFVSARIWLNATTAGYPYPDTRTFQAWKITIQAGWPDGASLLDEVPTLYHAVGLLVAHYATLGRDLATIERGTLDEIPQGYSDLIAPFVPISVI